MTLCDTPMTPFPRRVTLCVTPPPACWFAYPHLSNHKVDSPVVSTWRRRAALGIFGAWGLVSLARLSRLVERPESPPGGDDLGTVLDFFRASIPASAGYLFVEPGAFGSDTGLGQRLRYELYPRSYDKVRLPADEVQVRQLMREENLSFVVVPDASQYPPTSWLRQAPDWLRRVELDSNRYVLAVVD